MTWPVLLDYTRDECKRILRKLELEAYASIVSAFRAQGELSKEKKRILQDLCSSLSISVERHRAEIRRAVNDEKLGTVAERMFGPNTSMEWAVEGRRLIPLMPRLVPQTAFTALANNLADLQASKNAAMPVPSATGRSLKLETQVDESPDGSLKRKCSVSDASGVPAKIPTMMPSPTTSNVPLMSDIIQLSPLLSPHQVQANMSLSPPITQIASVSAPLISPSLAFAAQNTVVVTQTQSPIPSTGLLTAAQLPVVSVSSNQSSVMPLTINTSTPLSLATPTRGVARALTTVGQRQIAPALQAIPQVTNATPSSKQVILVSGSTTNIPPSILQRCLSVPVVKNLSTSNTTTSVTTGQKSSNSASQTLPTTPRITGNVSVGVSQISNSGNMVVYTTTRGRGSRGTGIRQAVVRPRPSLVVPIQQQAAAASGMHASSALIGLSGLVSSQQAGNLIKTTGRGGRGRSAGTGRGMKIGPQMMMLSSPNTTSTRILPKPTMTSLGISNISQTSLASSLSSPLVVMGSTNLQASISKAANMSPSSPRIVNVMSVTPAPTRILPPTNTYSVASKNAKMTKLSNIVTLCGSSTTSTTASLSPSITGSGMKPNVIVVQKAPAWPQTVQQQFGKQLISKIPQNIRPQKGVGSLTVGKMLSAAVAGIAGTKRATSSPIVHSISSTNQPIAPHVSESFDATQLDPSNLDPKNTLLADLIQAAGIVLPEGTTATVPVSASAMKVLPSNIASSSLRKIAGLSSVSNTTGFLGNVARKATQIKSPKNVKSNTPPIKKVITQTIPKLPPSIMITQQSDSEIEEIVIQKKVSTLSVSKGKEKAGFESGVPAEQKVESENNTLIVESPTKVIEEVHIEDNVLEVPTSEILITSSPTSTFDSNVTVGTSSISTFPQEVFTADITASTAVIEQSSDTNNVHSDMFPSDVISDISTTTATTEVSKSSLAEAPVISEIVVDGMGSTSIDEASNSVSYHAEIPHLHEGQVFEIQAPESVIKLLTSGHLTKEVIDLIQSVGIKFDGDTPLTLETTITEESIKTIETSTCEEIHESPEPTKDSLFQTESDHQLKDINQTASSVLEVYDSSGSVTLIDNQLESIHVEETDKESGTHVTLEPQQVLTEDVDSHFVVGECITIDHANSDLLVSEEVVGSSELGEVATMETSVEETVPLSSCDDIRLSNVEVSQMETNEIPTDVSGVETMSLLEELMEQHKDNFN